MRKRPSGRCIAVGLFLVATTWITGCATLGKQFETPKVSVAAIEILEATLFETVFKTELRIINPNDFELPIRGADCRLMLNGSDLLQGGSDVEVTIPAYGTAKVPVKLYSSVVDVVRGIIGLKGKQTLTYELSGKFRVRAVGLPVTLPFSSQGELSLEGIPPLHLNQPLKPAL